MVVKVSKMNLRVLREQKWHTGRDCLLEVKGTVLPYFSGTSEALDHGVQSKGKEGVLERKACSYSPVRERTVHIVNSISYERSCQLQEGA